MRQLAALRGRVWEVAEDHPEWWLLGLSALAWVAMLPHIIGSHPACHASFGEAWRAWVLMIVAMMLPLMLDSARWTADRSFRSRQHRAISGYLLGYLLPWSAVGLIAAWAQTAWPNAWAAPASFLLAGAWALTRWSERLHALRLRTVPLTPAGWRADLDCVRLGVLQGGPCVGTCGLLMFGCALTGHGFVAMAAGAALGWLEHQDWEPRPGRTALGCVVLAVWYSGLW